MTLTNLEKTPWPWFGGKADAADHVWAALGDPAHYAEPFYGSGAVHLRRRMSRETTSLLSTVAALGGGL